MRKRPHAASRPRRALGEHSPAIVTTIITYTDVLMGISLATFNSNGGVTTYAADVVSIQQSAVSVSVVSGTLAALRQRELASSSSSGSSSVLVTVSLTVPQTTAASIRAQLLTKQPQLTKAVQGRGGIFSSVTTQGATLQGAPTRMPSAAPSFLPPSPTPTLSPTLFPTTRFTQFPTNRPTRRIAVASSSGTSSSKGTTLSGGALAGIVIAVVAFVAAGIYVLATRARHDEEGKERSHLEDFYGRKSLEGGDGFKPYVNSRGSIGGRASGGSFSQTSPVHDPYGHGHGRESFSGGQRRLSLGAGPAITGRSSIGGGGHDSLSRGRDSLGGGHQTGPRRPSLTAGSKLAGGSVSSVSSKRPSLSPGPARSPAAAAGGGHTYEL